MSKTSKEDGTTRRGFLKLAGTAAPAAAVAVAAGGQEAQADDLSIDDGRMKDTAHTRAYFDSARF